MRMVEKAERASMRIRVRVVEVAGLRKAQLILLLALAYSVLAGAQTESYTWGNVAIGGGGFVTGIIPSKSEQDLMYARTDVGGGYRWNALSKKWTPLLDWVSENEIGYMGVESIAIDPVET